MSVLFDPEALAKNLAATPREIETATYRAINKTVRSLEVLVAREVGSDVGIAARFIRERMMSERANLRKLRGALRERVASMPAHIFGSLQTESGVRASKYFFKSAFHARLGGRGERVYRRLGPRRYPVKKVYVEIEGASRAVFDRIMPRVWEVFTKNFDHELRFAMGLLSGKR